MDSNTSPAVPAPAPPLPTPPAPPPLHPTELDHTLVSHWLDNHPEFLNDYLRKLQLHRRISTINDNNKSLLSNINSHHTHKERGFSFSAGSGDPKHTTSPLGNASANTTSEFQVSFGSNSSPNQYYASAVSSNAGRLVKNSSFSSSISSSGLSSSSGSGSSANGSSSLFF